MTSLMSTMIAAVASWGGELLCNTHHANGKASKADFIASGFLLHPLRSAIGRRAGVADGRERTSLARSLGDALTKREGTYLGGTYEKGMPRVFVIVLTKLLPIDGEPLFFTCGYPGQ